MRHSLRILLQKSTPPSKAGRTGFAIRSTRIPSPTPATLLCDPGQGSQPHDSNSSGVHGVDRKADWDCTCEGLGNEPGTQEVYGGRLQTVRKHDGKQSQGINRVRMGGGGRAVKRYHLFTSLHFQPFYYVVTLKKKNNNKNKKSKPSGSQEWIISCLWNPQETESRITLPI